MATNTTASPFSALRSYFDALDTRGSADEKKGLPVIRVQLGDDGDTNSVGVPDDGEDIDDPGFEVDYDSIPDADDDERSDAENSLLYLDAPAPALTCSRKPAGEPAGTRPCPHMTGFQCSYADRCCRLIAQQADAETERQRAALMAAFRPKR